MTVVRALPVILALAAVLAIACGGNGDGAGTPSSGASPPTGDVTPSEGATPGGSSSSTFDDLRAELIENLEMIGVNIGSVPDDVGAKLLEQCWSLAEHTDDDVDAACSGIERAIDTDDYGLIDLVLEELAGMDGG